MLRRLRGHINYASATATIALIVALGGTSYAALTLPRNSVGHRQLRAGAVRAREVKDGALGVDKFSSKARHSLRGDVGAVGPQGPQGPPGIALFSVMTAGGTPVAGNATQGGLTGTTGNYRVGFARSVVGCAATATIGTTDTSTAVAGRVTVNVSDGQVGVQTFAADGSPANLPFHLIVAC